MMAAMNIPIPDTTRDRSHDVRQHMLDTAQRMMGQKGFTAVGLSELLSAAGVPKGSFYHHFASKEAFGEALLTRYFTNYIQYMDEVLVGGTGTAAERLMRYWQHWQDTQAIEDPEGKCLAVKLGAEVSDLSESMRTALKQGTQSIIQRIGQCIEIGRLEGSLHLHTDSMQLAETLYQLWLGASLLAKITRDRKPLEAAYAATAQLLHNHKPAPSASP